MGEPVFTRVDDPLIEELVVIVRVPRSWMVSHSLVEVGAELVRLISREFFERAHYNREMAKKARARGE